MKDKYLIKPSDPQYFDCLNCGNTDIELQNIVFPGIEIYGETKCNKCKEEFLHPYPVAHTNYFGAAINKKNGESVAIKNIEYKPKIFTDYSLQNDRKISIERKVFKKDKQVIILNTLDFLYGHVLLKLANAQYFLENYPDFGLILIIPENFNWLIPQNITEVWVAKLKQSESREWYSEINKFIQDQFYRYERIYLANNLSHPDLQKIDVSTFTGIPPFPLEQFDSMAPTITMILREDRLWHEYRWQGLIYRASLRFHFFKRVKTIMVKWQNQAVRKTIIHIRKSLPEVKIILAGVGSIGRFPSNVEDLRSTKITNELEREWCHAYSKSHVVFGVHGSNMLIPSGLAASCVEILAENRYGNMVQDLWVRFNDRRLLFMYRILYRYEKPMVVSQHILSIINSYSIFKKSMGGILTKGIDNKPFSKEKSISIKNP